MNSILVTGGAGFIGSNLCEYFIKKNNQIVCLDNLITGKKENINHLIPNSNFKFIEGDITNLNTCNTACQDIDIILHQAWVKDESFKINQYCIRQLNS